MAPDIHNPELTVTRINRLMRPLRNRCDALMAFAGSTRPATCTTTTYSSRPCRPRNSVDIDSPPLAILQPPGSMHARTHFSKNAAERLEMSRRVYAVRDSFRDIVAKTSPGNSQPRCSGKGIVTLSAMCSMVIGANLRPESNVLEEDDETHGMNFVNEIYEAVPLEYRRWMVLSHALNMVLDTNVHDATLFTILFDVTTSHGLLSESSILLRSLLAIAFSFTNHTSPVAHPAHTTFLLDLRARWTDGGLPDPTFLSIVTQILSSTNDINLWTCKAMKRFAYNFFTANTTLFMRFLAIFSTIAIGADGPVRMNHCQTGSHAAQLCAQLNKWIRLVFGHQLSTPDSATITTEDSDAILDTLRACLISDLVTGTAHRNNDGTPFRDLQGAIISFATHWLSGPFPSVYSSDLAIIVDRLNVVVPQALTYDTLVQGLFIDFDFHNGQQALFKIAGALKSHSLHHLEASMWSCALRHIEVIENQRQFIAVNSANSFNLYRYQLIQLVEGAQRRCFGRNALSLAFTPTKPRECPSIRKSGGAAANHRCRWEPMVDDWIHDSAHQPSTKKRRLEGNPWLRSARLRHFSSHGEVGNMLKQASSMTVRPRRAPNEGLTDSTQKYKKLTPSHPPGQIHCYPHRHSCNTAENPGRDDECDDISLEECSWDGKSIGDSRETPLMRRPSNFASLVADAVTGRTELHVDLTDVRRDSHNTINSECRDSSPSRTVPSTSHVLYPPSDDSLDLFAYGQTSPVACY